MVRVLSPLQSRKLEIALVGFKKFKHILDMINEGYIFYPLPKSTYEKYLHEWDIFDLLLLEGLEEKYLRKVRPSWREKSLSWTETIAELKEIAQREALTARFFELWTLYMRRASIVTFIHDVQPYMATYESMKANDSSIVEKYIYSLWMQANGYKKGKGKGTLGDQLLKLIVDAIDNPKTNYNRIKYYKGLISDDGGLTRTVTDLTPAEIQQYIDDKYLDPSDFPEIFSAT